MLVAALAAACAPAVSTTSATPGPIASAASRPSASSAAPSQPRGIGPIRNEGQKIISSPEGLAWFIGEGSSSIATDVKNYALNGVSLEGSSLRCTKPGPNTCNAIEIIPASPLRNGVTYELTLGGSPLGTFTAQGIVSVIPHVLSVKATQFSLTVAFDRPVLHAGDCGTYGRNLGIPGTMEYVRANGTGFPAKIGSYSTTSAAYADFFRAFVSQADITGDCRTVKLGSGWGAPTGTFDVTVSGVKDESGNVVETRTFTVSIDDEGTPKLMFANVEFQSADRKTIRVAYSEAMDEEYVTDPERYYLNGKLVPVGTVIECEVASCTWVRITFAPSLFTYGANNTLTIVGVRDTAARAMDPDIVTSAPFQVF